MFVEDTYPTCLLLQLLMLLAEIENSFYQAWSALTLVVCGTRPHTRRSNICLFLIDGTDNVRVENASTALIDALAD